MGSRQVHSLPPCLLGTLPHLTFLIYTANIRNRHNHRRISHLHFSNLYKFRAFSLYGSGGSPRSLLPRLLAPLPPVPGAKIQRTLIYGNGINFSRKSLKTKDQSHA